MFTGLLPLLERLPLPNPYINDRSYTLTAFRKHERHLQETQTSLRYNELLPKAYTAFALSLNLPAPPADEALAFGASIGSWPAHPDTVAALRTLQKHYKLVILSNIDNATIARTIAGPLEGVRFDAVYTAETIGSYKPDLRNFQYLLEGVRREFGVPKHQVLHTAQALWHDLMPAKRMDLHAAWIDREGEDARLAEVRGEVDFGWRFETLGEMAEEVERAFGEERG